MSFETELDTEKCQVQGAPVNHVFAQGATVDHFFLGDTKHGMMADPSKHRLRTVIQEDWA